LLESKVEKTRRYTRN